MSLRIVIDTLTGAGAIHALRDAKQQPMDMAHGELSTATVVLGVDGTARVLHAIARRLPGARPEKASIGYLAPEVHAAAVPLSPLRRSVRIADGGGAGLRSGDDWRRACANAGDGAAEGLRRGGRWRASLLTDWSERRVSCRPHGGGADARKRRLRPTFSRQSKQRGEQSSVDM